MEVRLSKAVGTNSSNGPRVAVIGCGIFGAMTALRLAENGASVHVFERSHSALQGASYNNQNRLHLGFHYPRDDETARQCIKGFQQFRDEFGPCLMEGFPNAYFIASSGSVTQPKDYLDFCERVGLRYDMVDLDAFSPVVRDVAVGITTDEVVYDSSILRTLIDQRMNVAGVKPIFGADVTRILRDGSRYKIEVSGEHHGPFDAVVNCTYANINTFNAQLGHAAPVYQYEYTMVPIIEWDQPPVGITIMDGRFMTVLPFGQTGKFLLYHVEHTVVSTSIGTQMPASWLDPDLSPSQHVDLPDFFNTMKEACLQFVPALEGAKIVGYLQGPRMVLANRDSTDARPSIINRHEAGFWSVFTGKIDHCMWVSDEIASTICAQV